ncbi:MAG TPA: ABC transporter ATP-binding protein [Candidatus Dormibacteraeota bacterium]|nr:ABC transporter ATP-binding protein [Candidatus Dormibacteraeota bacterium]
MADIQLVNLHRTYRQGSHTVTALDGVDLRIESGEFTSIVGRSGSGKTTLLDIAGLLLRPTSGSVLFDGEDTARLSDGRRADLRARRIGFVFQEYNLLPALTVMENVTLACRYCGGDRREGRRRAAELLELVGLAHRLNHRPDELSGGQQQRVAIARALVNRPALVLGDEPTGAVDSQTSDELLALMRRLNREEGVTFVLVTHDLELAAQTDRVVRLADGHVIADDRTALAVGA